MGKQSWSTKPRADCHRDAQTQRVVWYRHAKTVQESTSSKDRDGREISKQLQRIQRSCAQSRQRVGWKVQLTQIDVWE